MASGVVYNHIPQTISKIQKARNQLVRKGAFDIERVAKQLAPVDTGLLKASIYTVTSESSGAEASARSMVRRKGIGSSFVDLTFPQLAPSGDGSRAWVVVGAKYGAFVEFGTIHMRARPFLLPAYYGVRQSYVEGWVKGFEGLIR